MKEARFNVKHHHLHISSAGAKSLRSLNSSAKDHQVLPTKVKICDMNADLEFPSNYWQISKVCSKDARNHFHETEKRSIIKQGSGDIDIFYMQNKCRRSVRTERAGKDETTAWTLLANMRPSYSSLQDHIYQNCSLS